MHTKPFFIIAVLHLIDVRNAGTIKFQPDACNRTEYFLTSNVVGQVRPRVYL